MAVLLAGGLVGWEVFYRFAVLPLAFATATYKLATDAMFDEWASWVPNLEDVRWRTTSVIALLGAGVISVSLLLAPVLGRLYVAMGGSPVDPMSSAERVSGYLVLAVLAFVYGALPPVLRWRLPKG
ncbi:MAG: hypothetical protein H6721_29045 [Sandaracinus sp.]|nr:hypothetical protein [Sandaracinus sp.]